MDGWWLAVGVVAVGVAATLALDWVRCEVRYRSIGMAQAAEVKLWLLFGLYRRRWRIPPRRSAVRDTLGGFFARLQRKLVPGRRPHRIPPGHDRSPAWRAIDRMRGHVYLDDLHVACVLGTGSPATTAVAVGLAHAVVGTVLALLSTYLSIQDPRAGVELRPHYGRRRLALRLRCILRCRPGHLMAALLLALWRSLAHGPLRPRAWGHAAQEGVPGQ